MGAVLPSASACRTITSITLPFSACMQMSAPFFAVCCSARKIVASSTISTFGYAMKSLKLATPSRTMSSMSSRPASGKIGDDHVQPVIDAGLRFRLLPPGVQSVAHLGAAGLDGEIDDGGGAADGRRARSGFEIVARCRAAERHVEMRVRVDAAGQQQHAGGVQHLVAGLERNARAHFLDGLAFDQHIRGESFVRGHHRAVLNEQSH